MSDIQIRLATLDEVPLLHQIMQEAYAEYLGRLLPASGAHAETVADVTAAMINGGAVLAHLDGVPVGGARYRREQGFLYVGRISVLPAYRGRGIGAALVRYLEGIAQAAGYAEVQLGVRLALPGNVSLYQHLGFHIIALQVHPRGEDLRVVMAKQLPPATHDTDWLPNLLQRLTTELRQEEPNALAVAVLGSVARGEAGLFSDLDLRVITQGEPLVRDRFRLERRPDGGHVHLSIGARSLDEILTAGSDPERWAWLLPTYTDAKLLWEAPGTLTALQSQLHQMTPTPGAFGARAAYHLETLLEYAAKLKNAGLATDGQSGLLYAQRLADTCWHLIRPLNPLVTIRGEGDFVNQMLHLEVAPTHYPADALFCLGLVTEARPLPMVVWHGLRLAAETLDLVAAHAASFPLTQSLSEPLLDGSLRRYVTAEVSRPLTYSASTLP